MSGFRRKQKGVNDVTGRIIDLLTRPGAAHAHVAAQNPTLDRILGPLGMFRMDPNILTHGASQEQQGKDLQTIESSVGLPHNWLSDMGVGAMEDPTMALGASGASRAMFEAGTEHALPALMKQWAEHSGNDLVQHLGTKASQMHDFITPGGHNAAHALRTLALKDGRQGVQTYQALYGMRGAAEHSATDVTQALTTGFRRALSGLDNGERLQVFRAIDGGTIDSLPAKLKTAASDVQRYDRAIPWLGGSASLRKQMTTHGYALPEDLQQFDQGPRGVINADQFRANHVPGIHELDPDDALRLSKRYEMGLRSSKDLTQTRNVQFRSRDNPVPITDPRAVEEAFEGSFRRAGKQIAAADLRKTLAQHYAPIKEVQRSLPADDAVVTRAIEAYNQGNPLAKLTRQSFDKLSQSVQELLTRPFQATKTVRLTKRFPDVAQEIRDFFERPGEKMPETDWQQAQKLADKYIGGGTRYVSDLSRSLMFTTPFQHPMRIASLLLGHAPEQIPKAIEKYIRTGAGFAGPETRDKVLGDAARAGAAGAGNVEQSKLQEALLKIPLAGKPLSSWFGAVQKMVWGFDDAAKSALFEKYVKRYGDPYRAAYHVQHDMVDYGASSPMTEFGRSFSSFPTWRTRMPVAVARALAKNPHLFAMMARSAPALLGAQFGDNKKLSSTALGEGIGAFNEPDKYVRGSMSPSTRIGADLLGIHPPWYKGQNWASYGIDPITYGAKSLPGGSLVSPLFPSTPEEELLFQLFGIESLDDTPKPRRRRSHHRKAADE